MKVGERATERARQGGRKATARPPARSLATPWIENGLEGQKNEGRIQPLPARPRARPPGLLTPSLPRSHGMQADPLQLCQKSSLNCAHDQTPIQVKALSVVCVVV